MLPRAIFGVKGVITVWNDVETTQDFLNFTVVADTVAELIIESNGQPISIGVSGNWGAGKSSMVRMIGESLKKSDEERDGKEKNYVFLEFNAWLYQGYDDARTALMQAVSDKLDTEVAARKPDKEIVNKVKDFSKRIKWLQLAKLLLPLAASFIPGVAPAGVIATLLGSISTIKTGSNDSTLAASIESAVPEFGELLKDSSEKSTPRQVQELRDSFEEILQKLNITLVVLVDDLDRCLPSTAISTLEAMRLLLFVPHTAFIIAADEQMIRNGVKAHFNNVELSDGLVTSYFDKLIQIPLTVPHLGVGEVKIYLVLLFAELASRRGDIEQKDYNSAKDKLVALLRNAWQGGISKSKIESAFDKAVLDKIQNDIDMSEQLAGILVSAENIKGNPRLIKRFLNALKIREKVAKLNGFTLDVSTLVKMLLFERCASEGAFEFLIKQADASEDGKLEFLKGLESDLASGQIYKAPTTTWQSLFIENWLKLAPTLGDIDIRPLLYLSKDRSLALAAYDELSPEARELLDALNLIDSATILTDLVDRLKAVGETESEMLLNRIIRIGRTNQWDVKVLYSALHITEAFPSLGDKLVNALGEIPPQSRKAAYVPVLKERTWAQAMLIQWSKDVKTPNFVTNQLIDTKERKK
jgi:predicted KAP-like P-loop ATPase